MGPVLMRTLRAGAPARLVARAAGGVHRDARGGPCDVSGDGTDTVKPSSSRAAWKGLRGTGVWAFAHEQDSRSDVARPIRSLPDTLLSALDERVALRDLTSPYSVGDPHLYPYELTTFALPELRNGETANYPIVMELARSEEHTSELQSH